jgi:hypothetical protein
MRGVVLLSQGVDAIFLFQFIAMKIKQLSIYVNYCQRDAIRKT